VDGTLLKTKVSKEKTMRGQRLYSPIALNKAFNREFEKRGWSTKKANRIIVETHVPETGSNHIGFREMDAIKNKLGVEVQFGKYAFMVYNVSAKMTIFKKKGLIDAGVEIVPMHSLAEEMSSGVSHFEQMKTDLEMRGESNIDIPALIIGIDVMRRPEPSQPLVDKPLKISSNLLVSHSSGALATFSFPVGTHILLPRGRFFKLPSKASRTL
jgi:hypothetical protein